jgi:hypothetical protein
MMWIDSVCAGDSRRMWKNIRKEKKLGRTRLRWKNSNKKDFK